MSVLPKRAPRSQDNSLLTICSSTVKSSWTHERLERSERRSWSSLILLLTCSSSLSCCTVTMSSSWAAPAYMFYVSYESSRVESLEQSKVEETKKATKTRERTSWDPFFIFVVFVRILDESLQDSFLEPSLHLRSRNRVRECRNESIGIGPNILAWHEESGVKSAETKSEEESSVTKVQLVALVFFFILTFQVCIRNSPRQCPQTDIESLFGILSEKQSRLSMSKWEAKRDLNGRWFLMQHLWSF